MFLFFISLSFSNNLFDCHIEDGQYKCKSKDKIIYRERLPNGRLPPCPQGFEQVVIGYDNIKRLQEVEDRFAALYAQSQNLKKKYRFETLNKRVAILDQKIRDYYALYSADQITAEQLKDYKKLSSLYKKALVIYNDFVLKNNIIINKSLAIRNEYIDLINELTEKKKIYKCYNF